MIGFRMTVLFGDGPLTAVMSHRDLRNRRFLWDRRWSEAWTNRNDDVRRRNRRLVVRTPLVTLIVSVGRLAGPVHGSPTASSAPVRAASLPTALGRSANPGDTVADVAVWSASAGPTRRPTGPHSVTLR